MLQKSINEIKKTNESNWQAVNDAMVRSQPLAQRMLTHFFSDISALIQEHKDSSPRI